MIIVVIIVLRTNTQSISPGLVKTEASESIEGIDEIPHLNVEDLGQAVLYVLGTPPHVQVISTLLHFNF